jgi:3-methyladenine DNA glycosylase/8-oxoguanine DNA glycosylase
LLSLPGWPTTGLDPEVGARLGDYEIISRLMEVSGNGPWTVQGVLIIALEREDVVLPGDLALPKSVRSTYRLDYRRSGGPARGSISWPAGCSG